MCSVGFSPKDVRKSPSTFVVIDDSTKVQVEEVQAFIVAGALGRDITARERSYKQQTACLVVSRMNLMLYNTTRFPIKLTA